MPTTRLKRRPNPADIATDAKRRVDVSECDNQAIVAMVAMTTVMVMVVAVMIRRKGGGGG